MKYIEKMLLFYLRSSKIKLEITGFDMDGFEKAVHRELSRRLNTIEYIVSEDGEFSSDAERVAAIRACFSDDF